MLSWNGLCAALAAFLLACTPALAQGQGCSAFKWPLERERTLLVNASAVASGEGIAPSAGVLLKLVPFADARLPYAPERAPKKPGSFAGFVNVAAPSAPGVFRVTLSADGWIDVIQNGRVVKSGDFSGVTGCDGLRKSVKFELSAQPFVVQITDAPDPTIRLTVTPD
ncbi:MAG: hypothetical protein AB7K04_15765 [Pseudorhodoplanes sp.]